MKVQHTRLKPAEIVRRKLQAAGLKCTPQRREVFEQIVRMGGHFSAEQLAGRLRARSRSPVISRATVYRTLPLLVRCGLLREVIFTEHHSHYEIMYNRQHHEHFVCTKCGRTMEFDDSELERVLRKVARAARFEPVSHKVEVYGLCERCR